MGRWKSEADTQSYERRPRVVKGEAAGGRELLPVRQENGAWQARQAKSVPAPRKKRRGKAEGASTAEQEGGGSLAEELTFAQKRAAIAKLSASLLRSPHKSIGLLQQLLDLARRDASPAAQRLAALSLVAVLRDILPSYRIRLPTDTELSMQVSAEVEALRAYEKALLRGYEDVLGTLRGWLKGGSAAHRLAAAKGLSALLGKASDFNLNEALIGSIVPLCNWAEEGPREAALQAVTDLFQSAPAGDPALIAVRHMASLLKSSSFNVRPELLESWLHLRLDGASAAGGKSDERWGKRKGKRRRQGVDVVGRELAAAAGDRGDHSLKQAAVLEQMFVSYARVVKKNPAGPLMPPTLRGIAKYAHQVNLELLLDLVSNLRAVLREPEALPAASALHTVHALLRLLSGHGSALTVDMRDVQQRLYSLLSEPEVINDPRLLATALDCLEHLCKQRSALLAGRVASFFVRLLDASATLPHAHAVAALTAAARLLTACPRVASILDGLDRAGPGPGLLAAGEAEQDVDSPAALASTAWTLSLLSRHFHPPVAQLARKIARGEPIPTRLANATPLRLMAAYSEASGAFNPAPPTPAKRKTAGDAGGGRAGGRAGGWGAVPAGGALHEVMAEAVEGAGKGRAPVEFGGWMKGVKRRRRA